MHRRGGNIAHSRIVPAKGQEDEDILRRAKNSRRRKISRRRLNFVQTAPLSTLYPVAVPLLE